MAQINKPNEYFNTVLYTGDGANYPSTQAITGVGFQPDLIWLKSRNNAYPHFVYDAVRTNKYAIFTNDTQAENSGTVNQMTSFDSDGFQVANDGGGVATNGSGSTMTSWNWLGANGTSANTDGSISSTVSANTTSGFSIVKYTGTGSASTIGHGLSSAPKMVIVKTISTTGVWLTWHTGISINGNLQIQASDAVYNPGTGIYWNSTLPTSSVFSVGTSGASNGSGVEYIAYCFADVQGYSKFGSYTGNGSTDGTFVYTGFKPAFVITKRTDGTGNWLMYDNKRIGYNPSNYFLNTRLTNAEDTSNSEWLDLYSNGFKTRVTSTTVNGSGNSYIYMAFAEEPLVGTNNIPATAR